MNRAFYTLALITFSVIYVVSILSGREVSR